jgi:hypothetical protein
MEPKRATDGRLELRHAGDLDGLPDLRGQTTPFLRSETVCQCSCTVINVQGHKSRHRDADHIERPVRPSLARRQAVVHNGARPGPESEPGNEKLRGHHGYYGVTGKSGALSRFL